MEILEQRLQNELQKLKEQIAALKSNLDETPDYTRGVGDPRITRWELDRALLEQLESRAKTLKQALASVDEGIYGTCELCGKPIHPDRLAVLPDTRLCIECARKQQS